MNRIQRISIGWAGFVLAVGAIACRAEPAVGPKQDQARQILQAAGAEGGLIVHLGCGDGKLTAALRTSEQTLVQGLAGDGADVDAARRYIQSQGIYGPVSVARLTGPQLPYADNLVNLLVVSEDYAIAREEMLRVLAPGGVMLSVPPSTFIPQPFKKPWPSDIDQWTHYLHGPDNNAVAKDLRVGPPAGVQWIEGPSWQRHHEMNANPNAMVSAQGRLFYIADEAPATVAGLPGRWVLVGRDAFNGMLLWKRPVPDWGWQAWSAVETGGRFNLPLHTPRRLVAVGDRVFVTLGFNAPLSALDAATGEVVKTYDGTDFTDEILFYDGRLVLTVNDGPQQADLLEDQDKPRAKRRASPSEIADPLENPAVKKRVTVLDAETGDILWTKDGFTGVVSSPISGHILRITRLLTAVDGGKVVCVEKDAIIAMDLNTGRELWRTPRPELPANPPSLRENLRNFSTLVLHEDMVLFLHTEESYDLATGTGRRGVLCRLFGLAAETGEILWSLPCSKWGPASEGDLFVIDGLAWTHHATDFALIGVDLHSGEVKRSISTQDAFDEVHHHRCFRNKATERYVLTGRRGIETIDIQQEQTTKNEWVRGACRYGIMPCNGLIYVPPHPCQCYIDVKLNGFYALSADRQGVAESQGDGATENRAARLQRGPAYPEAVRSNLPPSVSSLQTNQDWPTYRHDASRSGASTAAVPSRVMQLWQTQVGGNASACTIAGGRVFAAAVDEHRVIALNAADGSLLWHFTAGGRVDTPPTVDRDRVLVGAADGWVYCLRAADGALVWRFRMASDERQIMASGQLESPWPVHGTVLISDGVAYVAAGRSTHLDGGIRVCALNPETGELLGELHPVGEEVEGLDDVLVGAGDRVYLRHLEFRLNNQPTAETTEERAASPASGRRAYSTAGLLDDSCFARVGWTTRSDLKKNGKGKTGAPADLLVFDDHSTFAFRTQRTGGFGGWFQAGTGAYELVAIDHQTGKPRWAAKIPLRVRALAASGQFVIAAGMPDTVDPRDAWASIEGRAGGALYVIDKADGDKLAEYPLDVAPRWDGLSITDGRIFVSSLDGRIACLGAPDQR
jgi:outer membrane protein assembly factor BamB